MEGQRGPGAKGSEHETALRTADVALVDQLLELDGAANYIATVPPSRTAAGELVPHSIATTDQYGEADLQAAGSDNIAACGKSLPGAKTQDPP